MSTPARSRSTATARSGRDGYGLHLYYRVRPGQETPRGRALAPGLELKAAGQLVVLPPSSHRSGRRYAWDARPPFYPGPLMPVPVAEPPSWMLDAPQVEPATIPTASKALNGAVATRYGAKVMREELERLANAPVGARNDTLYRVTVRLAELARAGHLAGPEVLRRVEIAAAHAYSGEGLYEQAGTIASAFRKAGVLV